MAMQINDAISTANKSMSDKMINADELGAKPIKKSTRGMNPMPSPIRNCHLLFLLVEGGWPDVEDGAG
jgi:hypothetical protein